jgi:hypothetical protein
LSIKIFGTSSWQKLKRVDLDSIEPEEARLEEA